MTAPPAPEGRGGEGRGSWITGSEEETRAVGRRLADRLAPDGVALLSGELGSGKTVLARGIAEGLGVDPGEVQSPTFVLMREHWGRAGGDGGGERVRRLVHLDLYRLEPEEVWNLGLEEMLAGPGVTVVEWAERLPVDVPGALEVVLERRGETEREIRVSAKAADS